MKNIPTKYLVFIWILFISISCDFDDLNEDPTRPNAENIPAEAIMPIMQTQTHRNLTSNLGRIAGIITQQWTGFDAQQVAFTSYVIGESDVDNTWQLGLYSGALRSCENIIERTSVSGDLLTRGIAKIYMATNLGFTTSAWGDVPFSEAFKGIENLTPSYDTQESIYNSIQTLLDEAIADINSGNGSGTGLITLGNEAWVKIAKSLKARFYLHQTSINTNAAQLALNEVTSGISSSAEQGDFIFENTQNGGHPIALFGIQRPNTMIVDSNFATIMDGDPRKDIYMIPVDGGNFNFYQADNTDLFWAQLDSPSFLISYFETKFIEAEALVRTGADGFPALIEAITANMQYLGVESNEINAYLAGINFTGSQEERIEVIINEKYKALYGSAPMEIWNDYRRTSYPSLTPNVDGVNGNNESGVIPRRFLYPISERTTNDASYRAAIERQGGHLLDDDMWIYPLN